MIHKINPIVHVETEQNIPILDWNNARNVRVINMVIMTVRIVVKFELVVDEFVNEDLVFGVGNSDKQVLCLSFPAVGNAGEHITFFA